MGLLVFSICFLAILALGVAIVVIMWRWLSDSAGSSADSVTSEEGDVATLAADNIFNISRTSDCQYIVKTGVISSVSTLTDSSQDEINFGSAYLVYGQNVQGAEIKISATLPGGNVKASPGDIILLNCYYQGNITLVSSGDIKQFINLDNGGLETYDLSMFPIKPFKFYKITYLGEVDGAETVGIQISRAGLNTQAILFYLF